MRAVVLAAILLAGCAAAPAPTPHDGVEPPTSVPTIAATEPYRESNGSWAIEVDEPIDGRVGDVVNFTIVVRWTGAGDPPQDAALSAEARWINMSGRARQAIVGAESRVPASLILGRDDALGLSIDAPSGSVRFAGPPVRVATPSRTIAAQTPTNVSDDPPGLHVETSAHHVRLTYAPPHNATTTIDERDVPDGAFALDDVPGGAKLVGFVTRVTSDAVAQLPQPERPRVVLDADVPSGALHVRVATQISCFCLGREPRMESIDVAVP